MLDLDGLGAGDAVRTDIDHASIPDPGGGVGDRRGARRRIGAVDGDAVLQPGAAIGRQIGPWGRIGEVDAVAPAPAMPGAAVLVAPLQRRLQQDAKIGPDLLVDLGGDIGVRHRGGQASERRREGGDQAGLEEAAAQRTSLSLSWTAERAPEPRG